jgi:hydrophobe/amphiphile efflux-1 (HAE1) family protein
MFMRWPTTFIPEEDDGFFLISAQLPPASSLERTEAVGESINKLLDSYPEVKTYIEISGFSVISGGELSNTGTYFVILKDWKERKGKEHSATAVVNRFNQEAYNIQEAQVFAMIPPAIPGLGASGGLQLQLEDRKNLGPIEMQQAIETLLNSYQTKDELLNLSSMYQANVPQYKLEINRDKVQLLGLQLNQVFSTLSYYMGAAYVNDFIDFGHIYQVKIEANEQAQKVIDDIMHLSIINTNGKMVPFSAFTEVKGQLGLDQINLYNMYKSASITCIANPKYSSGQAIQAMEDLVQKELGNNFGYEWTTVAYQETQAGSTTILVFALALLIAYLVLSAQYESWTSPIAAIIGLPIALLGSLIGCFIMGIPISIYTQIGIILLIALSAKNGILIVEFAQDYRKAGNSIREAAQEAGHIRLRPILMTSFAFVLGVMPLLFATGAGANSRITLGTAVVFGMAVNTLFATLFIPSFYELMQQFQEKVLDKIGK